MQQNEQDHDYVDTETYEEKMRYAEKTGQLPEVEVEMPEPTQGLYVAIEGPDGSGKTLACDYIKELLKEQDQDIQQINILSTHFNSLALRKIVTNPDTEMHPRTELAFYIAAVLNSLTQLVGPMTQDGFNVLTDRGPDSSLVYQCLTLGKKDPAMLEMHNAAFAGMMPDVTIYLEPASAEEGLERCAKRDGALDRLELRGPEYQRAVIDNYKLVYGARLFKDEKVFWIKNDSSKETLKENIRQVLVRVGMIKEN